MDKTFLKSAAPALAPATLLAAPVALDMRLRVARYALHSEKLGQSVRLALLSDLHSCYYGPCGKQILDVLAAQRPDAVLMAGDMADDRRNNHNTFAFMRALGRTGIPAYYVSGNHEVWSGRLPLWKAMFRARGIRVLEGECETPDIRGQRIALCGVDDPEWDHQGHLRQVARTAKRAGASRAYSVLLAHRPEYAPWYALHGYDLILCGHAHGGQWRFPPFNNGTFAADQGLFPKLAGGYYRIEDSDVVISRGLARESTPIPRIFNRPEVVLVDLLPAPPPPQMTAKTRPIPRPHCAG